MYQRSAPSICRTMRSLVECIPTPDHSSVRIRGHHGAVIRVDKGHPSATSRPCTWPMPKIPSRTSVLSKCQCRFREHSLPIPAILCDSLSDSSLSRSAFSVRLRSGDFFDEAFVVEQPPVGSHTLLQLKETWMIVASLRFSRHSNPERLLVRQSAQRRPRAQPGRPKLPGSHSSLNC